MSTKSLFGIDAIDFGIQAAITGILIFWATEVNNPQDGVVISCMTAAVSLVVLGVRRRLALRAKPAPGLSTGEMAAERIAELEERLGELDAVHARLAELEERLDFAERLLADTNSPLKSVGPGEGR